MRNVTNNSKEATKREAHLLIFALLDIVLKNIADTNKIPELHILKIEFPFQGYIHEASAAKMSKRRVKMA